MWALSESPTPLLVTPTHLTDGSTMSPFESHKFDSETSYIENTWDESVSIVFLLRGAIVNRAEYCQ